MGWSLWFCTLTYWQTNTACKTHKNKDEGQQGQTNTCVPTVYQKRAIIELTKIMNYILPPRRCSLSHCLCHRRNSVHKCELSTITCRPMGRCFFKRKQWGHFILPFKLTSFCKIFCSSSFIKLSHGPANWKYQGLPVQVVPAQLPSQSHWHIASMNVPLFEQELIEQSARLNNRQQIL